MWHDRVSARDLLDLTSTAKQVLGNCERMVFASFVGNFNFDSFNPTFLFTFAVNL